MKKTLLTLCLLLTFLCVYRADAQGVFWTEVNGVECRFAILSDNKVSISLSYDGSYYNFERFDIPSTVQRYDDNGHPIGTYTVVAIGDRAFMECQYLTSVTIPNSVTSIGDGAFTDCHSLTSVTLPNSITSIGDYAFSQCGNMTSVTLPNSITTIGNSVFLCCYRLTSITIPNSVTTIGDGAFYDCDALTSITIPNSVTTIGDRAFYGCSALTSVTIPNSVTTIGSAAFWGCSSLTSITLPNSVTTIGSAAFAGCGNLTSVTLPNSVTTIGWAAFAYCTSLTSITLPNSVTTIGEKAFWQCNRLTEISFPVSLTDIGDEAFKDCTALRKVTFMRDVPPTIGPNSFENVPSEIPVYVPCSSLQAYVNAQYYNHFTNYNAYGVCDEGGDPLSISLSDNTQIHTYANERQVVVEGAEGLSVALYDMQGRRLHYTTAEYGTLLRLPVPSTGVYMVRIGDYAAQRVVVMR